MTPMRRLPALGSYAAVTLGANLIWETAQLPLYTIWRTGGPSEIAFAVLHCTGGDLVIAVSALFLALSIAGHRDWPSMSFPRVAMLTVAFGVGYTIYSEWLNVSVRASWAYSDLMPVVPGLGVGLSPLMQWILIPSVALWTARRCMSDRGGFRRGG